MPTSFAIQQWPFFYTTRQVILDSGIPISPMQTSKNMHHSGQEIYTSHAQSLSAANSLDDLDITRTSFEQAATQQLNDLCNHPRSMKVEELIPAPI